jgi:hypothetical protein
MGGQLTGFSLKTSQINKRSSFTFQVNFSKLPHISYYIYHLQFHLCMATPRMATRTDYHVFNTFSMCHKTVSGNHRSHWRKQCFFPSFISVLTPNILVLSHLLGSLALHKMTELQTKRTTCKECLWSMIWPASDISRPQTILNSHNRDSHTAGRWIQ